MLYGQQVSTIAALRTTDTSCAAGATRLKLGVLADALGVLAGHGDGATRSSAPPTGPPTPPSGMRTPRAMFRAPISEPDSATASSHHVER